LLSHKIDGGDDVTNALAPGNESEPLAHHTVPEQATLIMAGLRGCQERAT